MDSMHDFKYANFVCPSCGEEKISLASGICESCGQQHVLITCDRCGGTFLEDDLGYKDAHTALCANCYNAYEIE